VTLRRPLAWIAVHYRTRMHHTSRETTSQTRRMRAIHHTAIRSVSYPGSPLWSPTPATYGAGSFGDEYEDQKSTQSDDYDQRTRLTSWDNASAVGSGSYAPLRNIFQTADHKALMDKVFPGEVADGETAEVIGEKPACQCWVALC
jgi:hypothetical protein